MGGSILQIIYSGGADVDILPASASKGKALDFLLQQVSYATEFFSEGVTMHVHPFTHACVRAETRNFRHTPDLWMRALLMA